MHLYAHWHTQRHAQNASFTSSLQGMHSHILMRIHTKCDRNLVNGLDSTVELSADGQIDRRTDGQTSDKTLVSSQSVPCVELGKNKQTNKQTSQRNREIEINWNRIGRDLNWSDLVQFIFYTKYLIGFDQVRPFSYVYAYLDSKKAKTSGFKLADVINLVAALPSWYQKTHRPLTYSHPTLMSFSLCCSCCRYIFHFGKNEFRERNSLLVGVGNGNAKNTIETCSQISRPILLVCEFQCNRSICDRRNQIWVCS